MKLVKKEQLITKEFLFSKIDYYDVYRYYIGNFTIGQKFKSPFHKDNNPSFGVYMRNGKLQHNDFADDRYRGDCIDFVQQMYNLDIKTAIEKIAKDFGIADGKDESERITSLYTKPFIDQKRHAFIQVSTRAWNKEDAAYWKQFGITREQLKEEQVYPLKELFLNRIRQGIDKDELVYAYRYLEGFKIYFPNREKTKKWLSNIPLDCPQHLENLSLEHNALVVKSLKDYLVCKQIYPYTCYVQNESIGSVSENTARRITEMSKKVYYGGDSDVPGKKASYRITGAYNWNHVNPPDQLLPKIKDFADWAKECGIEPIREHFLKKKIIT